MSDNTSFDKVINDLKDKFNSFSNTNRSTYYNFMEFIDNIEELANTVADNLNSIADDIDDITNDIMYGDSTIDYNDIVNHNETNEEVKKDEGKKETVDIERFKEKINSSADECRLKLEEIANIIKDFDYASRKSYEDSYLDLKRSLEEDFNTMKGTKSLNEFTEKFNKVIDYINNLYKSAYYKKNNKSSLAFIIDDEEDIIYIEKINANEFIKQFEL
ncbi:hypothetical protein [Brachyspira alvinipulli]|uniref:hypothetical protein n=1 Tax=Brachyspira alvinipulli TaxID=84379 RepID=UPI000483DCCF|nr:hypothetical protein [Brachyspira alvinipulli]